MSDIKASVEVEDGKEPLIYLADFQRDVSMDRMTSLFDDLLNTFLKYAENEISFEKFLEAGMEHIYATMTILFLSGVTVSESQSNYKSTVFCF